MDGISKQRLFADLEDPRQAHKVRYPLDEIVLLAIFAMLSDAQSGTEMQAFGEAKRGG